MVTYSDESRATAIGGQSQATVTGSVDPTSGNYEYTMSSSALDNNNSTTTVDTSDTHAVNGVTLPAEAHLALTPLPETQVLSSVALP